MKYPIFTFLVLMLALSIEINARDESFSKDNGKSCEPYKIGILAPSKDIDFKMTIIVPPKEIDQAMVINLCPEQNQVVSIPQIIVPRRKRNDFFFKVPPFIIKSSHSTQ